MRDDAKNFSRGLLAVIVGVGTLSLLSALLITMYESHEVGTLRAVPGSGPALSTDFKGPMLEQAEGEVLARVRANEEKMLHSAFKWAAKKAREYAQSSLKPGGSNKYSTTYSHHKPLNPER